MTAQKVALVTGQDGAYLAEFLLKKGYQLDPDLLAALRASGPGWQTRVNELLQREVLGKGA